MSELKLAWQWRENLGFFKKNQALRVFHGPGESLEDLKNIAIDRFQEHYWVTQWEGAKTFSPEKLSRIQNQVIDFLSKQGAVSIVEMVRPDKQIPQEPVIWYGIPPAERFTIQEAELKFWIQLQGSRHPGLFLDHFPLRQWLLQHSAQKRVLNTFAYTGSLSVAAAMGGAQSVTTLDLSKPSILWAQENFKLNALSESKHQFIFGDVFEWIPRLKKKKETFDCIILDPPSFSHGKKQLFSTAKDLEKLHFLAMELLSPQGILITSINSSNISWKKYETDVFSAAKKHQFEFKILKQIDLPESFPTRFGSSSRESPERYLKGWILQKS